MKPCLCAILLALALSQSAFAGGENRGSGEYENVHRLLDNVQERLTYYVGWNKNWKSFAPYRKLPQGWSVERMISVIQTIQRRPTESPTYVGKHGAPERMMFSWAVENGQPVIIVYQPFFEIYKTVPKTESAESYKSAAEDALERIVHELSHIIWDFPEETVEEYAKCVSERISNLNFSIIGTEASVWVVMKALEEQTVFKVQAAQNPYSCDATERKGLLEDEGRFGKLSLDSLGYKTKDDMARLINRLMVYMPDSEPWMRPWLKRWLKPERKVGQLFDGLSMEFQCLTNWNNFQPHYLPVWATDYLGRNSLNGDDLAKINRQKLNAYSDPRFDTWSKAREDSFRKCGMDDHWKWNRWNN